MNVVNLVGNLGRDPELKEVGSTTLGKLSLAIDNFVRKDGEYVQETLWVTVTLWGKNAVNAGKILRKGDGVAVTGHLQKRTWETEDGEKRSIMDIIGDRWQKTGGSRASDTGLGRGGDEQYDF